MLNRKKFLKATGLNHVPGKWRIHSAQREEEKHPPLFSRRGRVIVHETHAIDKGVLLFGNPDKVDQIGVEVPTQRVGILFQDFSMTARYCQGKGEAKGHFGRLTAPKAVMEEFYQRYADVRNVRTNTLVLGLFGPERGSKLVCDAWLPLLGLVLTHVEYCVEAGGIDVLEEVHFVSRGAIVMLRREKEGKLVYTLDDPRWRRTCVEEEEKEEDATAT